MNPDPPAGVDPETGPQFGFCLRNPEDPRCFATIPPRQIPPPDRPLDAPGQDVDPERAPQLGFCFHFPNDPRCAIAGPPPKIPPPDRPVESPGVGVLP